MFLAIGVKVTYLKRTHLGDFQLDPNLDEGDYRSLNQDELEAYQELSRTKSIDYIFFLSLILGHAS